MEFLMVLAVIFPIITEVNSCNRAAVVCYESLGCFGSALPCHKKRGLPEAPEKVNTTFFLYTPESQGAYDLLNLQDDSSILASHFQSNRTTKFIVHGFNSNAMLRWVSLMKDALLKLGNFNVIVVDWSNGAEIIGTGILSLYDSYKIARENARLVGREIAELSKKLASLTGATYSMTHLIGHGLGAHVAGYAGEHLSGAYGRITGLNPAGPLFETYDAQLRCHLDASDAQFVDIIHTDTQYGYGKPVGHQDFFPNGGRLQPGCTIQEAADVRCADTRALELFIESINSDCSFLAYPCDNWFDFLKGKCRRECGDGEAVVGGCARMGYFSDLSTSDGNFMLGTNKNSPYCRNDSGFNQVIV